MRFIVDAQLPAALARFLESYGHDAKHVFDVGLANAEDKVIW
jgi:predicted nuclease of predicted toxin-antitoxin system